MRLGRHFIFRPYEITETKSSVAECMHMLHSFVWAIQLVNNVKSSHSLFHEFIVSCLTFVSFYQCFTKLTPLLLRRKLCMREDGRQQVCIVGLQEFEVSDLQIVKEYIVRGNAARSTGSTGANEESSRSHAILQLVVKKHNEVKDYRQNNDGNDYKGGKVIGKISFIDLAGSERGADTTDNDRQTR